MKLNSHLPLCFFWVMGIVSFTAAQDRPAPYIPPSAPTSTPSPPAAAASTTASAPAATTVTTLPDLKEHPELWPPQLLLNHDVKLTITKDGAVIGAIVSPAGAAVALTGVNDTNIEIGVASARAMVSPDQTDLWARVAAMAAAATAPTPTPTPTPSSSSTTAASGTSTNSSDPNYIPPLVPQAITPLPTPPPLAAPTITSETPVIIDYDAPPRDNFTKAAFRFWTPAYAQPIRGIIVLVPGLDGDGRGTINDRAWQTLAQKYRLALVGCFFHGNNYYNAANGTGSALIEALKNFAQTTGHAEIASVPLLLSGESAGGQFNYDFTLWKTDKVMAFVVNKGVNYASGTPGLRMYFTPGLFFLGMNDTPQRIKNITDLWNAGRSKGALWALAPQPNSGHEFSLTPAMTRVFFESVLRGRLAEDGAADPSQMTNLDENQGWIGNLTTHEIHKLSLTDGDNRKASWLPDESSAVAWKIFVSGASVPPAPVTGRPTPVPGAVVRPN